MPVYEYIDKSTLPWEYLPDDYSGASAGTIAEVVGKYTVCTNPRV